MSAMTPNDFDSVLAECRRLRDLLDRRPAMNAGLLEAYAQWTSEVYASDMGMLPKPGEAH
jgi:hypothetical protein